MNVDELNASIGDYRTQHDYAEDNDATKGTTYDVPQPRIRQQETVDKDMTLTRCDWSFRSF
jgi:hypothetical protein